MAKRWLLALTLYWILSLVLILSLSCPIRVSRLSSHVFACDELEPVLFLLSNIVLPSS